MITARRSADRGYFDFGWLKTFHTFSFGRYYDPDFENFSVLRVLNQDRVAPGRGFGTHGHDNMEIVSYVLEGALEHQDSMGNGSQMRSGEVQLMSAGSGVTHSEFNASRDEGLHFLQMWILPAERNTAPRYEQRMFSVDKRSGQLRLVVSPDGRNESLTIGQDVALCAGIIRPDDRITYEFEPGRCGWLHVARGGIRVVDLELADGDGAAIIDETRVTLLGVEEADVVLWDLPAM